MNESSIMEDIVMIVSTVIASIGIVANFTVIVVFLNDKETEKKDTEYIYHPPGKLNVDLFLTIVRIYY